VFETCHKQDGAHCSTSQRTEGAAQPAREAVRPAARQPVPV